MGKNRCLTYWSHSFYYNYLSCLTTIPTNWHVRPAKTQINLGIRPVWSESSLSTWGKRMSLAILRAHSEASDQTGRMPMLIWVFAGRKGHFVCFVMRRLILLCHTSVNNIDFCYFVAFYFLKLPEKTRFLCIHARVCLSSFIMSCCRRVVILTFIFHDGRRVSLFIYIPSSRPKGRHKGGIFGGERLRGHLQG